MLRVLTEVREIQTAYGSIQCKTVRMGQNIVNVTPEYEDCKRIAIDHAIPLKDVINLARSKLLATLCA